MPGFMIKNIHSCMIRLSDFESFKHEEVRDSECLRKIFHRFPDISQKGGSQNP